MTSTTKHHKFYKLGFLEVAESTAERIGVGRDIGRRSSSRKLGETVQWRELLMVRMQKIFTLPRTRNGD